MSLQNLGDIKANEGRSWKTMEHHCFPYHNAEMREIDLAQRWGGVGLPGLERKQESKKTECPTKCKRN